MAEAEKEPFSIVYEEEEGRPFIPVGGVYGSITVDGSMVYAHIYSQFSTLPAMDEYEIEADGSVDLSKGNSIRRGNLTRKVLATLVISPEVAGSMGKWLSDKSEQAKVAREERSKKEAAAEQAKKGCPYPLLQRSQDRRVHEAVPGLGVQGLQRLTVGENESPARGHPSTIERANRLRHGRPELPQHPPVQGEVEGR